jgi:DNA-binding IclR family transcriptional regulator
MQSTVIVACVSETVRRAAELIEFVASGVRTLREISERFAVHRSTVFRQLKTLERAGFLVHRDDGTWAIGMRLVAIGQQALEELDLRRIAHPALRELHRQVGGTVHLAQLIGDGIHYVDKVEDTDGVRMSSRVGGQVDAVRTGVGTAILAHLPAPDRTRILDAEAARGAEPPRDDRAVLERRLTDIRGRGWAADDGEFEEFVNCLAVPVLSSAGRIHGAVSISAIRAARPLTELRGELGRLQHCAAEIARQLG